MVDPELDVFENWIDAVHTAMMVYQEDGSRSCGQFLKRSGLLTDGTFKACLQALINVVPRTQEKGAFVRSEAAILENLRLAFFDDIEAPPEEAPPKVEKQKPLFETEEEDEN